MHAPAVVLHGPAVDMESPVLHGPAMRASVQHSSGMHSRAHGRAPGREGRSKARGVWLLVGFSLLLLVLPGCITRNVRTKVVDRHLIEVDLVRQVDGFTTQTLGYEHPAIISAPRLENILGALEIEVVDGPAMIRQPAIHEDILKETAEALAEGLAAAGGNDTVEVRAIRKDMRLGIFHRKFLTSFLAYVNDAHLYIMLRRVEWPIPRSQENEALPHPQRDEKNMDFRVITAEPIYFAGLQDVEIDWRDEAFRQAFRMPGSTGGERRRREVLDSIPVPKDEIRSGAQGELSVDQLSPEKLRALADLEEERRGGRITETDYQRAKRDILRKR